jgi:protein SCO1
MQRIRCILGSAILLFTVTGAHSQAVPDNVGQASSGLPPVLQNVGFEPQLNAQLPLDLAFRDEGGHAVQLRDYFGARPVVLALVYYGCPMLCSQVEEGVIGSLRMLSFNPGRDYEVVFVSFDSRETPEMASQKKDWALSRFHRPETAGGWHFLTGSNESIRSLSQSVNFRFNFDEKNNFYAHASGIMLLTPQGRISRYFYGVEYPARDVRLGLVDSSAGKIGTPIDHVLLYCYQYDPATTRYSASILKIMRLGAVLTVLCLVVGILIFRRRDFEAARKNHQGAH